MTEREFKDHFSEHAGDYARHRPGYPDALFDWVAEIAPATSLLWDCATGNGQAAVPLSHRFDRVIATDASPEQIAAARATDRVEYRVAPAESSGLDDASVDAITVAQALHWFDHDAFFAEARRVLHPGGVLVAWCYELVRVSAAVDEVTNRFYRDTVGAYWPPERRLLEEGYRQISMPLAEIDAPAFAIEMTWTADALVAYISTWSAVRRFRAATGSDPIPALAIDIARAWGNEAHDVVFPLSIRAGRRD